MNYTLIIMALGSLGFVFMGAFILLNKSIKQMYTDNSNEEKNAINLKFIKSNAYINLAIGIIGLLITCISFIKPEWNNILIILFVVNIVVSALIQFIIGRKYKK